MEENALRATEPVFCKETNTHLRGDRNSFTEKGMSEKQTEFQQVEKERRNIMSQDCDGGAVKGTLMCQSCTLGGELGA